MLARRDAFYMCIKTEPTEFCPAAVPEAVTSLRTSLRLLDINHNRGLRFTKESKARVLQLHILRRSVPAQASGACVACLNPAAMLTCFP